jgi:hypothetical protein
MNTNLDRFSEDYAIMFYNMDHANRGFFDNLEPEHLPYTYEQVMDMTNEQFEECHDFIQWLFPTKTLSNFNPIAPVVTDFFYNNIRKDRAIEATRKMCSFLGFSLYSPIINYNRVKEWWSDENHNTLRVTRMLQFLEGCKFYYELEFIKYKLDICEHKFGKLKSSEYWFNV